ncbi:hypothetical protein [Nocardioides cynanchi]|uniref:hypothetical protein n=1 Tax=Nocardioides cynanchi TaxID=2558918 RepID=UPI001248B00E|nr:hypothetical protein [Nocardioides cynanchi]
MAERVVLHIGTMKSGTSFVQSALMSSPEVLDRAGARYLGGTFGRQAKAVRDVYRRPTRPRRHQRWQALVDEARDFDGEAGIISMEFLGFASDDQLSLFLDPFAGLPVDVVLTVRDQFRAIPAQWQTFTRNFGTDDWATYLRRIDHAPWSPDRKSRAARTFSRAQDVVGVLDRWSADPRVGSLTVVTLPGPEAPREELWHRFCTAARVPVGDAVLEEAKENTSLGYASCDFLRRLNPLLEDVKPRLYRKGMRPLARDVLAPLRETEGRPELDRRGAAFARGLNQRIRDAVRTGGYDVVGTLDDLPVPVELDHPEQAAAPASELVRRAAECTREHAARMLGKDVRQAPQGLDDLVADSARLLRRAYRWGR